MEIISLLLSFLGGGACGALITEFFRRRRARMQPIPLIERVNRLVGSDLAGFVLARTIGEGQDRHLEEIQKVREYQFTLRNSSDIHLHNAEIQFDFPSADVEARAERPARSKTMPVSTEAVISKPWKKGVRWRIPELPPGDSIDFTFRAVDASSDEYEVALYGGSQVVIEKSKGEPAPKKEFFIKANTLLNGICLVSVACAAFMIFIMTTSSVRNKVTNIDLAGCSLNITSSYWQENGSFLSFPHGPWKLNTYILNTGNQKCFVKWDSVLGSPVTIEPSQDLFATGVYTNTKPRLASEQLLFGPDGLTNKATVMLYER
jgi:hypothetical protein